MSANSHRDYCSIRYTIIICHYPFFKGAVSATPLGPSWAAGPGIFGGSCILGLGLVKVRFKVRFKVSIGGRVRVSFFGSFRVRVRVRGGVRVRFWLGPGLGVRG